METIQHDNISEFYPLLWCRLYRGDDDDLRSSSVMGSELPNSLRTLTGSCVGGTSCAEEILILNGYEHTTTFLIDTGGAAGCGCLHCL
ncbi:hypothetical protein BR93DRAFT_926210 [Coniochaeta sp. PMI_546]|nr:hypothetical protein BR93DRAFT_926210 [Coniochaeta sp. PMI_546]